MEQQHLGGEPDSATGLVPKREEKCVVCGQAGVLVDDGWYKEAFVEQDAEEGDYLAGEDYLIEAEDTPSGWVCSKQCESQAMYQQQDEGGKKALDRVADACRVVDEYGDRARKMVNGLTSGYVGEELVIQAREFLHSVSADGDDLPAWLNRPSREEKMEIVMNEVRTTAEYMAKGLFGPEKAAEIVEKIKEASGGGR
jgi:hypothetical protein